MKMNKIGILFVFALVLLVGGNANAEIARNSSNDYKYYDSQLGGEDNSCFLPGTVIKMADGKEKPIEDIKIGDSVWVGEGRVDKVMGIVIKSEPEWFSFGTGLAGPAGNRVFFTVPNQIFFTIMYNKDGSPSSTNEIIREARSLKVGDQIRRDDGKFALIRSINPIQKNVVIIFNLILQSSTFYYANGIKVHSVIE